MLQKMWIPHEVPLQKGNSPGQQDWSETKISSGIWKASQASKGFTPCIYHSDICESVANIRVGHTLTDIGVINAW
jgi:hypothetical protein